MDTLIRFVGPLVCAAILLPAPARADLISGDTPPGGLGVFEAQFSYVVNDSGHALLTFQLLNTSPTGNGGYITGFAFNAPNGVITGITLMGTNASFKLIGGPAFDGGINAAPYGKFDVGAALGGDFLGGGQPSPGVGVGESAAFTFALTGQELDSLTAASFARELSSSVKSDEPGAAVVVRFRGFLDGGSDKVPGGPAGVETTPEPATAVLAVTGGVLGLLWHVRRRKGSVEGSRAGDGT